ncbi:MAG TPA: peptidylprolyl isomerase [Terriglobales bacterium]|nr:peptidylprolyl isomerase [Terriglobales bacterium]
MIRFLQTPGPIKKIVLGGLLTVICVFMVITLVPGFGNTDFFGSRTRPGIVATVEGSDITRLEVQRQAKAMIQQQFPQGGAQASKLLPFFAAQAAEQLITREALVAEARRLGLRATDEDVRDELEHGRYSQYFFPNGNFIGQAAYEEKLQSANLTVTQFEQDTKEQILIDKVQALIAGGAIVSDAEVREKFEKENAKVKFDYAVIRKDDLLKTIHPTESELKAYYDQHKASYTNSIPEKRKLGYVWIDTAKLQADIEPTPQEFEAYYDQHRDQYRSPEQVKVRHILIKTPLPGPDGKVDPAGVEQARKKAEDVLKQLKAGGDFAELAKKYSEDTASAKEGGSLGWIERGRTVPEFEKVAFSLPKGSTSDLVESSYGFHIIQVEDKQDARVKSLEEVKAQIEPALKHDKAAQAAEAKATALLSQARTLGLEKAAAAAGLGVVTTDYVARTDSLPGIGNSPPFMDAVFSAAENAPPDELQLPEGYAVFDVLAVKPPATPTFEEIRSRVENEFKQERATNLLSQKTQELSDRAKAEHDLKKAAKELDAVMKTSELVAPDGQVPDLGSLAGPASVAFSLKPGEISGPIDTTTAGAVLELLERQQPTEQEYVAKKDQIRESLLTQKQSELFETYLGGLRERMEKSGKITINQQELRSLTKQTEDEGE